MSYCLMSRPPSQMNLREQATPGETADAVIMVFVSIQAFQTGKRGAREGSSSLTG